MTRKSRRELLSVVAAGALSGCSFLKDDTESERTTDNTEYERTTGLLKPGCGEEDVWPGFQNDHRNTGGLDWTTPELRSPDFIEVAPSILEDTAPVFGQDSYFVNQGQRLVSYDIRTHQEEWRREYDGYSGVTPNKQCGLIVYQTGNAVVARTASDGSRQWKRNFGHGVSEPNLLTTEQGIFLCGGQKILSLSYDGTVEWTTERNNLFSGVVLSGSHLVVCGGGERSQGEVVALDPGDGSVQWSRTGIRPGTPPSADDRSVYLTERDGTVWSLDLSTGNTQWTTNVGGTQLYATPAVDDSRNALYTPTGSTGDVVGIDSANGEELWRTDAGQFATSEVVFTDTQVFHLGNSLQAIDPTDGSRIWKREKVTQAGVPALTQGALWLNANEHLVRVSDSN